jgi:hypothetical protein
VLAANVFFPPLVLNSVDGPYRTLASQLDAALELPRRRTSRRGCFSGVEFGWLIGNIGEGVTPVNCKVVRSKKHHYIPKALLRNFCFSGEATYFLKKEAKADQPKLRNIDSIFHRRHYNSYRSPNSNQDDGLEKFFAYEFDNYIPDWIEVFKKSLTSGEITFSSKQSRIRFVIYFYHHMKRTPEFSEPIVEKVSKEVFSDEGLISLEKRFRSLTPTEKTKFSSSDYQDHVTWNSRVRNMGHHSEKIIRILSRMQIFVATPERKQKQLIVGSNPVIRFENHIRQQLGTPGVELWTTMSPEIAVGFAAPEGSRGEVLLLPDNYLRRLNTQIAKQSSSIASKSPKLLSSIAKAVW